MAYSGGQSSTIPLPDRVPAGQAHAQDHAADHAFRPGIAAVVTALAYFIGAEVGFALTFHPHPISALWPPNAVLLAALLLTAVRSWWLIIAAVLPVHLAAEVQAGFPVPMVLGWFVTNCSEALIGASLVRRLAGRLPRFDSFQYVSVFMLCGALIAPLLSSFIDVAMIKLLGQRPMAVLHVPAALAEHSEHLRQRGEVVAVVRAEDLDLVQAHTLVDVVGGDRRTRGAGAAFTRLTRCEHQTGEHCSCDSCQHTAQHTRAGTPLMLAAPSIAIDLPMKIVIWENVEEEPRCPTTAGRT